MTVAINDLIFAHSGGVTNYDPTLDLGGLLSTSAFKQVLSQTPSTPVNVTGVTLVNAYGNPEGIGTLSFTFATKTLMWKPYGQTTFYGMAAATSGTYVIGSSSGYLVVTVNAAGYPGVDRTDSITIGNTGQNVFDNVTSSQSLQGKTSYRCLYIRNNNAVDSAPDVRVWLKTDTPGGDNLSFGLDPAGKGNGSSTGVAQVIVNETTAPTGVTFTAPTDWASAIQIGTLAPLQSVALWVKRTVPPETRGTVISNTGVLSLSTTV